MTVPAPAVDPVVDPGDAAPSAAPVERTVTTALPVDLRLTLGPLARGRNDPTTRFTAGGVWRATRGPSGPVTTHIVVRPGGRELHMRAWGPGSDWAIGGFAALIGADDHLDGFEPAHPLVADLHLRMPGLRIGRTASVTEALVPIILEQKVIGLEATRAYHRLVRALGEPAPGPGAAAGLVVPPHPDVWARTPSWTFHRAGVERKRADTVRVACSYWRRLEEVVSMSPEAAAARLRVLPGIGPWTAAGVALVALGDADAVCVGDFHLPNQVAFALAGEPRGTDERMLELLEPYRGHRGRVTRLLTAGAPAPPRYGPRLALQNIARL